MCLFSHSVGLLEFGRSSWVAPSQAVLVSAPAPLTVLSLCGVSTDSQALDVCARERGVPLVPVPLSSPTGTTVKGVRSVCARHEVILMGRSVTFFTHSHVSVPLLDQHREPFIIRDRCWVSAS